MKQIAPYNYYDKTAGAISMQPLIGRNQLLLIVNTTRNVTYYNFADSATTLQSFANNANGGTVPTLITLNSAVVAASSSHSNSDALVIYYDDLGSPSKTISELPYIKVNVNVENLDGTISSNVYLRKIGEYNYESIRYKGGEDEAYLRLYLDEGSDSSLRRWRLYSYGAFADIQGLVATVFPQNAGSSNGDPLPPKTGWTLEAGISGNLSVSYEQPAPVTLGAGTAQIGSVSVSALGATNDAVATTDTGTFSVIALIKRGLQNWTSLLAKIPTLVSGRIPVDGSGVTQPVSLASLPLPAGASTETTLSLVNTKIPSNLTVSSTRLLVDVYPAQGTTASRSNFSSINVDSSLVSAVAGRKVLTVFNEGAGILYISAGSTCSTASYQVRLSAGDYWECPEGQASLAHSAVFATAGTARVTQVS